MRRPRGHWPFPAIAAVLLASCNPVLGADGSLIPPQATLRVGVMQFVPSSGDYKTWAAFGGDYVVGADGTIVLPSLGPIAVGNEGPQALAAKISDQLQKKLGLLLKPDTTVQVVGYPPIYVVGAVKTPGEYPFRQGMTVLQALAISGGQPNGTDTDTSQSEGITLRANLQRVSNGVLRTTARIARLEAELTGADQITFPPQLDRKQEVMAEILLQENTIFQARRNEVDRQTTALKHLGDLYEAELKVLEEKVTALDKQSVKAAAELERVTGLVKDGMATVARQSDVEATLNNLRWDRLDNMVATMRAREGLSETQRNIASLEDNRRSEVAAALQQEQASLEQFRLDEATTVAQLKQVAALPALLATEAAAMKTTYTIVRQQDDKVAEIPAEEFTQLLPGDLVKVNVEIGAGAATSAETRPASLAAN